MFRKDGTDHIDGSCVQLMGVYKQMYKYQNSRLLPLLVFLCLSLTLISKLHARESVGFETPPAGTKVSWKRLDNGFTFSYTVRESEGDFLYSYFTEVGDERSAYIFCLYCWDPINEIDVERYGELYPLRVGAKVKLQRRRIGDSSTSWTHMIKVLKQEVIDVQFRNDPISTFVVEETIDNDQSDWSGKRTIWFAPSIRQNVKIVSNATDDNKEFTVELQRFIPPE